MKIDESRLEIVDSRNRSLVFLHNLKNFSVFELGSEIFLKIEDHQHSKSEGEQGRYYMVSHCLNLSEDDPYVEQILGSTKVRPLKSKLYIYDD